MRSKTGILQFALLSLTLLSATAAIALPTNNDPTNQIRFDTPAEADAKRAQLTNFIWSGGLPTSSLPTVTPNIGTGVLTGHLNGINGALVSSISRLDANVSNFDFHSISYVLSPSNTTNRNRVVLVHQGHSEAHEPLNVGVAPTVNALLAQGFTVNVLQMPMFGWNNDITAVVPGQGTLNYGTRYNGHAGIITRTGPASGGMGFRLFLEPVIQSINYFENLPELIDVSMIGISGGGWTTHLAAAVDTRITLSIPVAGSAPFYARDASGNPNTVGDAEQTYAPLFAEDIAANGTGGGVATWMEIYALGGYGEDRREIMVTNEFDSCCFAGTFADSFKNIVSDVVDELGLGDWEHYLDSTTNLHQIAPNTLSRILFPALGVVREVDFPGFPSLVPEPPGWLVWLTAAAVLMTTTGSGRRAIGWTTAETTPPRRSRAR